MSDYTVNIQQGSPVWNLYQKLKEKGVKDSDLDKGYPVTDYVKKTRKTAHQNDKVVDATEVLNYALENYEKFQLAIKQTTGYEVPWSLNDLAPAIDVARIRVKVDDAIAVFKPILTDKGLKEGSPRYQELMALSLFALTAASSSPVRYIPGNIKEELYKEGLKAVVVYSIENGRFATLTNIFNNPNKCQYEESALSSLLKDCQWSMGLSKSLYAVFREAGLKPKPMFVTPGYKLQEGQDSLHMVIGVKLGNKTRIFDPAMGLSDAGAAFKANKLFMFELTGSEFLADYFSGLGENFINTGRLPRAIDAFKKAVELNPGSAEAHLNLGTVYAKMFGLMDRAMAEYEVAIKLNPNSELGHSNLGLAYMRKGEIDRAIVEFKKALKINPKSADARAALEDCNSKKPVK